MTAQLTSSRRHSRRGGWTAWAFIAPVVIYLLVFYAYPLGRNVELSLRDYTVRSFIDGTAPFVGLDNYIKVFASATFAPALLNTALFVGVSILFQFSLGLALAMFFIKNFPLGSTLRALFLVPWLLPLLVSGSVWSWMLNSDSGVVNSFLEAVGHRSDQLADVAALVSGRCADCEYLDRHPVQSRDPLQRPAGHSR